MKAAILNTEAVNRHGFKILTGGINLENFKKNPVMYYNHLDYLSPVGRWENVRVENGQLIADPVFDTQDDTGRAVSRKWDEGFLNATSVGIVPLLKKNIEGIETWIDSEILEVSIVDIPSNPEAVKLKKENESIVRLNYVNSNMLNKPQKVKRVMERESLQEIAKALGLDSQVAETDILAAIEELKNDAENAVQLSKKHIEKLEQLKSEIAGQEAAEKQELVDKAVEQGFIKEIDKDTYLSFEKLALEKVIGDLRSKGKESSLADYVSEKITTTTELTFEQLSKTNPRELSRLKQEDPQEYQRLFKEEYGTKPQNI